MPAAVWGAILAAFLGTIGVIVAARINGRAALTSSLDARAAKVLEEALDYQSKEIDGLRGRVDVLEAEVQACERGRADDRKRWAAELADMRRELGHQ